MKKIINVQEVKKIINVQEVDGEGLVGLLGERVELFCMNYIYTGTLTGVNTHDVLLEDAAIVYETGPFDASKYTDAQKVGNLYVRSNSIESYRKTNKR